MKRNKMLALAAGAISVACSGAESQEELTGSATDALNGQLTSGGNLTRKSSVLNSPTNLSEAQRRTDTTNYYANAGVLPNGARLCPFTPPTGFNCSPNSNDNTVSVKLNTLKKFREFYGFTNVHTETFYYNRGDLGIGREMHCVDKMTNTNANGQVACYVRNFAAGDDKSEFSFGMSSSNAFRNMGTGNEFATVAMVFRDGAPSDQKVIFMVYGADASANGDGAGASLADAAALDRHGLHHAVNCFPTPGANCNPNPTPGVNFNNHIPTNCLSCHGGTYATSTRRVTNALFLPFDLDQFEYQDIAGRTRNNQQLKFRSLNEFVRKVAARAGAHGNNIVSQLDGWYANTPPVNPPLDPRLERLEGVFNGNFVPRDGSTLNPRQDWDQNDTTRAVYRSVVRPYCRGCHMSSVSTSVNFNRESQFRSLAFSSVTDLCNYNMPHALQTVREFWLSPAPFALDSYLRAPSVNQTAAADLLRNCNRGNVVTVDPHLALVSSPL